jgi:2-hydroxychromene-2-carboxylate isomerase
VSAATLELWFDFASTYSYLAAERAPALCAAAGITLVWRPFLLGPIFTAELGIKDSPFNVQKTRGRHMWRDVERLCEKHGLPWKRPSAFPRPSLLAARVACAAEGQPWLGDFVRAVYRANFGEDRDIGQPEVLAEVLRALGVDPAPMIAAAGSTEVKARLRANTEAAQAAGFFGAPSLLVGDELFFGQDRLEDAIAWARRLPKIDRPTDRQ